jgi:hypothetical protein
MQAACRPFKEVKPYYFTLHTKWRYTEAEKEVLFSAYCRMPLQLLLAYIKQPKALLANGG